MGELLTWAQEGSMRFRLLMYDTAAATHTPNWATLGWAGEEAPSGALGKPSYSNGVVRMQPRC